MFEMVFIYEVIRYLNTHKFFKPRSIRDAKTIHKPIILTSWFF